MKVQFKVSTSQKAKSTSSTTLVVFVAQAGATSGTKKAKKSLPSVQIYSSDAAVKTAVQDAVALKHFAGKMGETCFLRNSATGDYSHLLAVGLGSVAQMNADTVRRTAAHLAKTLKSLAFPMVDLLISANLPKKIQGEAFGQALSEGALLSAYDFTELKSDQKEEKSVTINLVFEGKNNPKALQNGMDTGETIAECVNFARRLGDNPGNLMTPSILAQETQNAAKGTGLKVTVWDKARIKKEKMGCLLGVSMGSDQEPRLIIMEYRGAPASKKPICFVGKGLTFDTGGISIKPSANMEEMKYDMCGGSATIGTMLAIAKLKLKVNVIGIVPASENMPGPSATKPGDIHTARNGKTVEVNNTDAEGRLILADALVYACEQKPAFIVDSATLTGAIVIALGDLHTGYFCRDTKLTKVIEDSAEESGEPIWQMPLVDEHGEDMKGTYADLNNISHNKGAGSAHGAGFLEFFVDKDIPWAHVDIAGTAWSTGHRVPYNPKKGASGVMIRTYVELAKRWK
ncbi:MAG: leucyl aminopeptidase [Bdellovibrionales bacterium]